jgi:uncharacterized protein (DUF427 family)
MTPEAPRLTKSMSTTRGRVRVEPSAKRVRVFLGGEIVADTTRAHLVWESPHYPQYYLPLADITDGVLVPDDGDVHHSPSRGDAQQYTVKAGGKAAKGAALRYAESPIEELRDLVRLDWAAMDNWFEEDEEVFVHPRNPYTRVDALPSTRHVRIELDGITLAESSRPVLLFETGLPVRYYLPKTHVRMDLLTPTESRTGCPYKGFAEYWTVTVNGTEHQDLAWSYPTPLPESRNVAGLVAFYDSKVDVYVDGVRQG